ncbi:MAG: phosphatase [Bacteroidetes bacterium]|nr:phosphatase [Bacteroidota bacterium]
MDINTVVSHFKGSFITPAEEIAAKLSGIKAFVFDWDGVFNNGVKDENGTSSFSEVDAMGTNLVRFNHYLRNNELPIVAIISGERNAMAWTLAKRESFHGVYSGIKFKAEALNHICEHHGIKPEEVCFVFDDVLDFSVAAAVGLRIMIPRACNPLLVEYAVQHNMVDYLTVCEGGNGAVREALELLIGLSGKYNETIDNRMNYTETYRSYIEMRNQQMPSFYSSKDSKIIEE